MVVFNQPPRSAFSDSRSNDSRSTSDLSCRRAERLDSRCSTFVMPQDAAERFVADDLLAFGEWLIFIGPLSGEWLVV